MAHLLILAHAPLASALKAVAAHAFPELMGRVASLDVDPLLLPEQVEAQACLVIQAWQAEDDADVLVLTDVFGATPCNVAQRLAHGPHVRVLAGVNVPMLWRALNYAALPLDELVTRSMAGGNQGVLPLASTRPQNQAVPPGSNDANHHHHQQ